MPHSASFLLLIEPEPHSGAWNMAVDEALLEAARRHNFSAVRFYRWNEPTLSLGYFQKIQPDNLPEELKPLARVRRLSGGGAILHHLEWTYSCVLPPEHPWAAEPVSLYEHVHRQVIKLLAELQISADLRGSAAADPGNKTFLCFGRQDPRDIVFGRHKIVGSAQRRRRGAVLQHGSLLLERSPFAPEFPGLLDLAETPVAVPELIQNLATRIGQVLSNPLGETAVEFHPQSKLPDEIAGAARELERDKYQTRAWR